MIPAQPTGKPSWADRLGPHWKGHFLLFEEKPPAPYAASAGLRLLLIFILFEGVIGPRLSLLTWLDLRVPPPWLHILILLVPVLVLIRHFARLRLADLGLYSWASWGPMEKSYFVQVFVLANLVFAGLFAKRLGHVFTESSLWAVLVAFTVHVLWGFYQELLYRGILQTELVRRWGVTAGILASNLVFTFGPLHFYHFSSAPSRAAGMFAGIFAIGLFFGLLFRRSGNLWIVGIFHGLGNGYIAGLAMLVR